MSSGTVKPWRSISLATCTISSSEGVINPLKPIRSAFSSRARAQNLFAAHHHAQVDHVVVVACEDHADDIFADVVHVTLHRREDDFALRLDDLARSLRSGLFCFHVGRQVRDSLLHDARRLHHLRKKHLARTEEIADDAHPGHQRPFNHQAAAGPASDTPLPRRPQCRCRSPSPVHD